MWRHRCVRVAVHRVGACGRPRPDRFGCGACCDCLARFGCIAVRAYDPDYRRLGWMVQNACAAQTNRRDSARCRERMAAPVRSDRNPRAGRPGRCRVADDGRRQSGARRGTSNHAPLCRRPLGRAGLLARSAQRRVVAANSAAASGQNSLCCAHMGTRAGGHARGHTCRAAHHCP